LLLGALLISTADSSIGVCESAAAVW
jgi:hypothetical protein